jgi:hypothetical protein
VALGGSGTATFQISSPDGQLYDETELKYVFEPPSYSRLNPDRARRP